MSGINSLCNSVCAGVIRVLPDKLWGHKGIACRNYSEFGIIPVIPHP